MIEKIIRRGCACFLLISLSVGFALPAFATDAPKGNAVLGSVTAVGDVQLRGRVVSQEGTVFTGDQIRTGSKGYAKVLMLNGNRAEVSEGSELVVNEDNQKKIAVGLASGKFGFTTSRNPFVISIGNYELSPKADAKGSVSYMGATVASIQMLSGSATLRNLTTKESMVVNSGQQHIVALTTAGPLAQIVSTVPSATPAAPARRQASVSTRTWAWLAAAAGGTAAILIWEPWDDDDCDSACRSTRDQAQRIAESVRATAQQATAAIATVVGSNAAAAAANTQIQGIINEINAEIAKLATVNSPGEADAILRNIRTLQGRLNTQLGALRTAGLPPTVTIPPNNNASASAPVKF